MKVLLIIEQCNPAASSVPLEGFNYFKEINQLCDVTLVTHERNRTALEKYPDYQNIIYIAESQFIKNYYQFVVPFASIGGRKNWPLHLTLTYPVYEEFNRKVYQQFKQPVLHQEYDLVHVLTPMMPRYPAKIIRACQNTPFLLGPVNGGVPFPAGFQKVARQEFAYLNFLRAIGRNLIPGYIETYQNADRILAGSSYTLNLIKDLFNTPDEQITLFYENGIAEEFLQQPTQKISKEKVDLLFVGRLVPYKGADMVIAAIAPLPEEIKTRIHLTIVGDGSEKRRLEEQVQQLNLADLITFTGWVKQNETLEYYRQSDIFCFPSIREFGGAVVLEAMACGLPCIVANNGGIGEYVTSEAGFSIEPLSRDYLIEQVTEKIKILVENETLRKEMSVNCYHRVQEFGWGQKAQKIAEIYQQLLAKPKNRLFTI